MTRLVLPFTENAFIRINKIGQLEGSFKTFEDTFFFLVLKLNITWISVENARTTNEIGIKAIEMIEQDRADMILGDYLLVNGSFMNVSAGICYDDNWCKIASSPFITSSVLTDGPESALKLLRIEFLSLVLISLILMTYLAFRRLTTDKFLPVWIVFSSMIRQHVHLCPKGLVLAANIVLLITSLLIQILYGSFLHTERTSISSFVKIDSYKHVQSYDLKKLVFDISPCPRLLRDKLKFEIVSLADAFLSKHNYGLCASSGKCTLLLSGPEYHIIKALTCSIDPKTITENPIYFSPPIARLVGGHLLNKRLPKKKRDLIDRYIQRSFEMGLQQGKCLTSERYGKQSAKSMTKLDLNEECFSKSFPKTSFSVPAPLNISFFMNCFFLYISTVLFSSMLFASSLYCCRTNPPDN